MTASPRLAPSPSTKMTDGGVAGDALAALFAAAAASSMQRQLSAQQTRTPKLAQTATTIKPAKHKPKLNGTPAKATVPNNVSDNCAAANLIATLLNGTAKSSPSSPRFASSSSLPPTKTTATFTATCATKQRLATYSPPPKVKLTATKAANDLKTLLPQASSSAETMPGNVELRNLEAWFDEDEEKLDDSYYQELVESNNTNGWSADEMFKYNEKRHKILSSYSEKTLSEYTTPLSKNKTKTTVRMASKLAKEIEDRVVADGRVTPESSDDDELFELERRQRVQLKKMKQLDQTKNIKSTANHSQNRFSLNKSNNEINVISKVRKSDRSSSQHSNSTETPVTASLSSSPTLNDPNNIKHVTSSSRNILRTCLT